MFKPNPWNWAFAVVEADLGRFKLPTLEIPVPDVVDYTPYANVITVADGGQRRYGYSQLRLTWETMNGRAYDKMSAFIIVAQASPNVMYATVDLYDSGRASSSAWYVDISGYPHFMPQAAPLAGSVAGRRGQKVFTNVTLFLNNITIINDPSNYADI